MIGSPPRPRRGRRSDGLEEARCAQRARHGLGDALRSASERTRGRRRLGRQAVDAGLQCQAGGHPTRPQPPPLPPARCEALAPRVVGCSRLALQASSKCGPAVGWPPHRGDLAAAAAVPPPSPACSRESAAASKRPRALPMRWGAASAYVPRIAGQGVAQRCPPLPHVTPVCGARSGELEVKSVRQQRARVRPRAAPRTHYAP